jgi:flavin-dependent dehydrogenase
LKILDSYFDDWSEDVQRLVHESMSNELRLWPLYDTPKPSEGGKWKANLGVTLIGDAAHVMPPWTGRGVNMALLDAVELGKKLGQLLCLGDTPNEKSGRKEVMKTLLDGLRAYEEGMWMRMEKEKDKNRKSQSLIFAEDSPMTFQEMMRQNGLPQT